MKSLFSQSLLSLSVLIFIAGCDNCTADVNRAAPHEKTIQGKAGAGQEIACPASDFGDFLQTFSERPEVQMAFTARPMQLDTIDVNADPEPKTVSNMISDISFPVIPNDKERMGEGLSLSIESVSADQAIAKLTKPDTGYQVRYYLETWVVGRCTESRTSLSKRSLLAYSRPQMRGLYLVGFF